MNAMDAMTAMDAMECVEVIVFPDLSRDRAHNLLRCRSLTQRDWSQEDSTSNEMRMHAMILLLLSTSMNDDADDSSSVSIPDTS